MAVAFAVGVPALRAEATVPPPGEEPWRDPTEYALWPEFNGIEDLEATASVDPAIAQLYEDFMFDFDEGCWEEAGESSQPMSIAGSTVWSERATTWMGRFELSEVLEPIEASELVAPTGVAESTVEFVARPELLEEFHLEAEAAVPWVAPAGWLETTEPEPNYPVSGYLVDTRYWDSDAEADFLDCIYASGQGAAFAFAQTTDLLVSASPSGPPDPGTIEACFSDIESAYGDPCLEATTALCTNIDWHQSWCGRRAYADQGGDPNWACFADIETAIDDYVTTTGAVQEPILLPAKMFGAGVTSEYPGLQRATGIKIPLNPDVAYGESDKGLADAQVGLADSFAAAAERLAWASNGQEVHSCREYAYERIQDLSTLTSGAKAHQRDARWVFDAAFDGRDGVGPFMTQVPTAPDFRRSDGQTVWFNPGSSIPDDGFVPWSRADKWAGEEYRRRHRLFEWHHLGFPFDTRLSTFKNVYYYLHRLRRGPTESGGADCEAFRQGLRSHYTVNSAWHRHMNAVAASAGFLDEEMELMRTKQDALWELYLQFLAADDPSMRSEFTAQIDEALREGFEAGCIPNDPSVPTPCDWAPGIFAEGVMERTEHWQEADFQRCADELGEGEFDDADLKAKFVDLSAAAVPISSTWMTILNNARNAALAYPDFTASVAGLHNYFFHMVGASGSGGYRDTILQAASTLGDDVLMRRAEFEKSMGGDFFGTSMQYITSGTPGSPAQGACAVLPESDSTGVLNIRLGSDAREVMRADTNFRDHGTLAAPEDEQEPRCEGSGWDCAWNVRVNGQLTHEPGYGTTLQGGFGGDISRSITILGPPAIPINMGWATAKLKLGAAGSIFAGATLQGSHTILDGTPEGGEDPDEAANNGGEAVCPSATISSLSLGAHVGGAIAGQVSFGVSIAQILEVGVRGSLTLLSATLPVSYTVTRSTANSLRTPIWDHDFRVSLLLEMLSGSISAYVALDALVVTIPLFELVIARWSGFRIDIPLFDDRVEAGDICISSELASIFGQTDHVFNNECPCVLRPSGCND